VTVDERLESSSGLDVKRESIKLFKIDVGDKDQFRSSDSQKYEANISVLRASISIELEMAFCSTEVNATES
jgi:hypothetical protein